MTPTASRVDDRRDVLAERDRRGRPGGQKSKWKQKRAATHNIYYYASETSTRAPGVLSLLNQMKAGGTGYFVAAVLVLSVAIALRVGPLSNESVDGDELFSRRAALARPAEGWKMVRQDLVHPPLYYFLLKATLPTGDSRTASEIRGLSLAAGAATLLTVFAIGIAVPVLRWPAMLAALLLAVNKTHIYYSQQARSYALYCFLAGLLLLWCILADRCWRRWWFWPGGTILMTALVWTHYVGALYCAVCVFPMLFMHYPGSTNRRTGNLLAAASLGSAGVLFLPWLIPEIAIYRAKSGLAENLEWQGVPTLFDLKYAFAQYAGIADFRGATTVALVTGTILVVCALWPTFGKEQFVLDTRIKITLALLALVPAILLFLTTRPPFNLPIFGERHLLPSIVPALMLMSYGLWRVAWVQPRLVLLLGATVLCALQIAPVYYDWRVRSANHTRLSPPIWNASRPILRSTPRGSTGSRSR